MTDHNPNATHTEDNKLIAERRAKLAELREQGNPFPNDFRRDATAAELQEKYGDKSKEELESMGIKVAIAGRMMLDRKAFKVVQDMTGRIQVYASRTCRKIQSTGTWAILLACEVPCPSLVRATFTSPWMSMCCSPSPCARCRRSTRA